MRNSVEKTLCRLVSGTFYEIVWDIKGYIKNIITAIFEIAGGCFVGLVVLQK